MVNLKIDSIDVCVEENTTILDAARSVGILIPSLCYLRGINEIGACRVCVVEIQGHDRLVPACNNVAKEGMVVYTNSPKVRQARRTNVELLLSQHDCQCAACVKSGNCSLQKVANDLGILTLPYEKKVPETRWNRKFPLFRDAAKCIKCMRCIQICDKVQSLNVWDVEGTGSRTTVDVSFHRNIANADCSLCGQCITHCPTGALRERDDTQKVFDALADPDVITVVQVAPAVRTAWAEFLDIAPEEATEGRLAASLRRIGFDYVFDTNFAADLTIMEEGSELLEHIQNPEGFSFPMFTSCCPGWVRFLKSQYPQMTGHLSTAKSPQQMFGAIAKTYFAQQIGAEPSKIFCVSIMPCLAKKHECALPNMNDSGCEHDVDVVLTTRELTRMIRSEHISPQLLPEEAFDSPLGEYSGAGVIFGATGGVMEAALRSAYFLATGRNPYPDQFAFARIKEGWAEQEVELLGNTYKVAIASSLGNARMLLEKIQRGEEQYHFVEIMACPGGCAGGGGQPIHDGQELAVSRAKTLYALDQNSKIRFSHENPEVQKLYEAFLEHPLSHKAHELLHTDHFAWQMPQKEPVVRKNQL